MSRRLAALIAAASATVLLAGVALVAAIPAHADGPKPPSVQKTITGW